MSLRRGKRRNAGREGGGGLVQRLSSAGKSGRRPRRCERDRSFDCAAVNSTTAQTATSTTREGVKFARVSRMGRSRSTSGSSRCWTGLRAPAKRKAFSLDCSTRASPRLGSPRIFHALRLSSTYIRRARTLGIGVDGVKDANPAFVGLPHLPPTCLSTSNTVGISARDLASEPKVSTPFFNRCRSSAGVCSSSRQGVTRFPAIGKAMDRARSRRRAGPGAWRDAVLDRRHSRMHRYRKESLQFGYTTHRKRFRLALNALAQISSKTG